MSKEMEITFVIPLEPRTKKNSQILTINRKTNRPQILPSKQYKLYESEAGYFVPELETIDYPVEITALFYMRTHRRVDLTNLLEGLDDLLVHHKVISDDNNTIVVSHDGSRVLYDKENPRTEITIRRCNEIQI